MLFFDDNFLSSLFEVRIKWLGCATGECLGLRKNLIRVCEFQFLTKSCNRGKGDRYEGGIAFCLPIGNERMERVRSQQQLLV